MGMPMRLAPPAPGKNVPAVQPAANIIALKPRDPWRCASATARQTAIHRESVVNCVRQLTEGGLSQSRAVALFILRAESGALPDHFTQAAKGAACVGKKTPGKSAIHAWIAQYREGGVNALLPEHKGRVVESSAWWGPALEYFNQPSKPDMAAVWRKLTEVDGFAVSYDQVRHYLLSVPSMVGKCSPARLGKNLYRLTEKRYVRRSTQNALAGDVYVADGYRGDIYLAHPITGDIWRPEFTCAIDLKSRVPVGWRADEHEGTYAVQNMWAECFARWNHVPPFLYIDNGSGYKNRFMDDALTGFYARAGVQQIIHAIPGNPHGKGWVERFFRIVKDDFIKVEFPAFYCGQDAAPEHLNHVVREVKAGRLQLPTLADFTIAFNAWIARYIKRAHPENQHVTRESLWQTLQPLPPAESVTELKRQAITLTVRRGSLKHGKREYGHADLIAFNHKQVVFEYDLMDNNVGIVRDLSGRWICDAHLIRMKDVIERSRLEEKRAARAADAVKRLEKKALEQRSRAGLVLDADALVDALPVPPETGNTDGLVLFDL